MRSYKIWKVITYNFFLKHFYHIFQENGQPEVQPAPIIQRRRVNISDILELRNPTRRTTAVSIAFIINLRHKIYFIFLVGKFLNIHRLLILQRQFEVNV